MGVNVGEFPLTRNAAQWPEAHYRLATEGQCWRDTVGPTPLVGNTACA